MENKEQLSVFGAGPKLFIITLAFFIITFILNSLYKELFLINIVSRSIQISIGIILLITGLTLHIICGKTILEVYKQDILYTSGVFKICRHPMYSAWIFFNLPGIALLLGSWILLTIPVIMYIIFRLLIKTEEKYLEKRYPDDYKNYIKETSLVFPCIWNVLKKN